MPSFGFGSRADNSIDKAPNAIDDYDVEKTPQVHNIYETNSDNAARGETYDVDNSFVAKVRRIGDKLNVEQRGIERVPEDERTDLRISNVGSMWLAANMVVSSFAIGVLGMSTFYLGFVDACLIVLFFNILGTLTVCFFSTFGPAFGLRQMVLSRFWFGWYPVKFIAFLNVIACIGWSAANSIVGAQLLNAINGTVPGYAGILVIVFVTFFITCSGYKVVHAYEYWSWIPTCIVFIILLGTFAHSGDFSNIPMGVGKSELGDCLSFGSTVYGFATGWTSYAADYTVYQPANVSKPKIFFSAWIGLMVPLLFTELLGLAVYSATYANGGVNKYMDGYNASGNGGLIDAALSPLGGFGKFCLVILALSIIANNCPNIYSVSLTMQVLSRWTHKVPRFVWTFLASCASLAISIPGYSDFNSVLNNFMNFIAYWLAIYSGISVADHFVFKRGFRGYDPEIYDKRNQLPIGISATIAFCFGIAGMITGMSQTWYIGPIAKYAGTEWGGDVGFELAFAFSFVIYCCLRPFELKYMGR